MLELRVAVTNSSAWYRSYTHLKVDFTFLVSPHLRSALIYAPLNNLLKLDNLGASEFRHRRISISENNSGAAEGYRQPVVRAANARVLLRD